jgi:hypothetical protein
MLSQNKPFLLPSTFDHLPITFPAIRIARSSQERFIAFHFSRSNQFC